MRSQLPMNCRRQPREPHWDAAADRDIARIEQLWQALRSTHGSDGGFLCGQFGIVDAMFAPVCVRFRGYGPPLQESTLDYMQRMLALPAMMDWMSAAEAEPARVAADEA